MTKPSPKVHPCGDIDDLNPLKGDAVHPRHIQPTPSHQKPIPLPASSQCNSCDTPSSCTREHRRHMGVNLDDPTYQNVPQTPDCPNDPDRTGMSCTSVYNISASTNSHHTRTGLESSPDILKSTWRRDDMYSHVNL